MTKDTFYFSHDHNARTDPKIKRLLAKHGMAGYGIFWAIVEDLYNNANALPLDCEAIAYDLRTDTKTITSIINDFGLFVIDGENFGSLSVERRLEQRNEKSQKARQSALSRWKKLPDDANAMRPHTDGNAIKESKGNKRKGFIAPQINEVVQYFEENGYTPEAGKKAFNYYSTAAWKDASGKQVKNWKQKMIAVWFKPENEKKEEKRVSKYQNTQMP